MRYIVYKSLYLQNFVDMMVNTTTLFRRSKSMRNLTLILAFVGLIAACAPSDECVQSRIHGGDIGTAIASCQATEFRIYWSNQ